MPLSADYIWRGFLGRRPPTPAPAPTPTLTPTPTPTPTRAGALGFQALALSPGLGRNRPAAWAAAAAASPARPTPGWPSPRPGPAIGRWGGAGGTGGAALWRQRTVEAGCSPVGCALSAEKDFLCSPPITWISSGEGRIFFLEVPFFFTVEDLRLGSNRGGGCRARGAPPTPGARLPGAWEGAAPAEGGPCTPGGSSGGECSPSSRLAPSPSQGRDRGRWAPRPPGPKGCGAAACGVDGNGSGEVAAGERAALSGPGARRLSGLRSPPLPPPRLPLEPLPRSPEGRVRPGGRKGARPPPASLVPGLGN